jgi:hypothetical protein
MKKEMICSSCGYVGNSKMNAKGSIGIEIVLWLCFIIPGLIYSLWRQSSYHPICPKCGNPSMIPIDTPRGEKMLAEQGKNIEQVHRQMILESKASPSSSKKVLWWSIGIFVALVLWAFIYYYYF